MKKILLILTISILGINLGLAQQNLTLQDAINIALNNNPGIKAGQNQIREAEEKICKQNLHSYLKQTFYQNIFTPIIHREWFLF